ncbi:hypothetical protein SGPA1_31366 [Streptomyces misionensis JCM 4497]
MGAFLDGRTADRRPARRPPGRELQRPAHGRAAHPPRGPDPARQPRGPRPRPPQPLRGGPGARQRGAAGGVPPHAGGARRAGSRRARAALRRPLPVPGRRPDRPGGDHRGHRTGPARHRALPAHRGPPHPDRDRPADPGGRRGTDLARPGPRAPVRRGGRRRDPGQHARRAGGDPLRGRDRARVREVPGGAGGRGLTTGRPCRRPWQGLSFRSC